MYAILGGTGLSKLNDLTVSRREVVRTPYGEPSCALTFGEVDGLPVVFLARHGYGHTVPPHAINYRANVWALHAAGVRKVISVATVGGISETLDPGQLVVPHQIIDYTHGRKCTFFDDLGVPVTHIDFTHPYDATLRDQLLTAGEFAGMNVIDGGVYGCTQGPRLETAAEIERMRRDGCDMVGMTGMPEAGLAREIGLQYAALCVVVNHAAGRGESKHAVEQEKMRLTLDTAMQSARQLVVRAFKQAA